MTPIEWISAINAASALIASVAAILGVAVGMRSVRVSTENKVALATVTARQTENKVDLKGDIQGMREDIKNGMGHAIVMKAMDTIKPVLAKEAAAANDKLLTTATVANDKLVRTASDANDKLVQTAIKAASEVAEQKAAWDGDDRRTGKPDRRGTKQ